MTDQLKAFYQKLSEDEALGAAYKALVADLRNNDVKAIIEFANGHGIALVEADFAQPKDGALSDDDLELVAGGDGMFDTWEDPEPPFANRDNWNF